MSKEINQLVSNLRNNFERKTSGNNFSMRKEWQTVEKEIQTWEMNSYCMTQETTDQSELEFAVVNT